MSWPASNSCNSVYYTGFRKVSRSQLWCTSWVSDFLWKWGHMIHDVFQLGKVHEYVVWEKREWEDIPISKIIYIREVQGWGVSVQLRCSVLSDSLWPHGLQHARPPCPSLTPGVHSDSCPLSQWCHPTISSPVFPFSSCFQSFPASGPFPMSQFFASGGQSIRVSALASSEYSGLISFRIDWLDFLADQGTLKSLL